MSLAKIRAKLAAGRAAKRAALEAVKLVDEWIRICAWDQVYHEALDFTVDRAMVAQLDEYLRWAAAHGHLPPVLRQHTEDGSNFGLVRGIEARDDGPYLQLGLHADVAARYAAGRLPYWSPHFEWEFPDPHRPSEDDPTKPHVWPVRLREMSFVSVPHLLNNPPANIALGSTTKSARVMCAAPSRGDKKMLTPEDIKAIADAVVPAVIAKLKAEMEVEVESEAEMADAPAEEMPAVQMASEMPKEESATMAALSSSVTALSSKVTTMAGENKTLKAKLAAQEKKAAEAEVRADLAGVELGAAEISSLVALKLSSEPQMATAYAVAINGHRAAAGASVSAEFGATGSAAQLPRQAGKVKTAALAAKAAKVEFGAPLLKHLREQGVDHRQFSDADWAEVDEAYGLKL
jgi:hypothetical protein